MIFTEHFVCGLDPGEVVLHHRNDVPEVLELYLYLNINVYLGELQRATAFKEKACKQPDNVNAGLLIYPTLMTADILLRRVVKVPMGKDQEQNMEMVRRFTRRSDTIYRAEYFMGPTLWIAVSKPIKVPGLNGLDKMGKSEGNTIYPYENDKFISKKVIRAVTDVGLTEPSSKPSKPTENLFAIVDLVSAPGTMAHFRQHYTDCSMRYRDLEKQLVPGLIAAIAPIRERILELSSDGDRLRKVATESAMKACENARKTIKEAREIIGFAPVL